MNDVLQQALSAIEAELRALDERRTLVATAWESLRTALGIDAGRATTGRVAQGAPQGPAVPARTPKNGVDVPRGRRSPLPRKAAEMGPESWAPLVRTLTEAGGSLSPGELATRSGLSAAVMRKRLGPAILAGVLVARGATTQRRISLPGRTPAKEEL